jgi:fructose-1,6-bisphosphatase I
MRGSGRCRALISEEEDKVIYFDEHPQARYVVACDPIDGSSNLDAGVPVGTIFGIMRLPDSVLESGERPTPEQLCMPGTELVAAG